MLEAIVELGYQPKIAPTRVSADHDEAGKSSDWVMPELLVAAMLEADAAHKFVFIDFFAEWCGTCKTLEATTFKDPSVVEAFKSYVFVKLDTDLHPNTARQFKIVGMPTLVVLDNNGEELYRHVGPIDADRLSHSLSTLAATEHIVQTD